ncbi:SRPBCC family protein [Arthrobacter sp. MDT3-24]
MPLSCGPANRKPFVENFMEPYHCATIHPELTEVLPRAVCWSPTNTTSAPSMTGSKSKSATRLSPPRPL